MDLEDKVTLAGAEGIDLDLVLAGIGSRGAAVMLDSVVQVVALIVIGFVSVQFGDAGAALFAIGVFGIVFGYPILMEAFAGGRTIGKMAVGIAVARTDGTPVTFLAATIRNVVRVIDLLPGVYTVGLISLLVTKRCQRLGDLAAGTIVVRPVRRTAPVGYDAGFGTGLGGGSARVLPEAPPEIATWDTSTLSLDEVAAVRAFLGRRHELAIGHRAQIAQTLAQQLLPKVAGIPLDGGPELFLERIAYARAFR